MKYLKMINEMVISDKKPGYINDEYLTPVVEKFNNIFNKFGITFKVCYISEGDDDRISVNIDFKLIENNYFKSLIKIMNKNAKGASMISKKGRRTSRFYLIYTNDPYGLSGSYADYVATSTALSSCGKNPNRDKPDPYIDIYYNIIDKMLNYLNVYSEDIGINGDLNTIHMPLFRDTLIDSFLSLKEGNEPNFIKILYDNVMKSEHAFKIIKGLKTKRDPLYKEFKIILTPTVTKMATEMGDLGF